MTARPLVALSLLAAPAAAAEPTAPVPPTPPVNLADWTPRPATGKAEPWEKATDKDWTDARFRLTDTGPFFNGTMLYPLGTQKERVYKATAVRLGDRGDAGIIFDRAAMRLAAGWTGGYLLHSDRRFGLMNTPTPVGAMRFASQAAPGWIGPNGRWDARPPYTAPLPADWARYRGLHVHGNRVVFEYTVGSRTVLETASVVGTKVVSTVQVGPGTEAVTLAGLPPAPSTLFAPRDAPQTVSRTPGDNAAAGAAVESPADLAKPGPARWGKPLVTKLERGKPDGPFAVDTLTIPADNPFKALFFCTGVDFLPDGRVAVCTAHGDVWLVAVVEAAGTCSWQRFATGLYHPLGLKVVDGKVVVLETGQLTRLHDENNDGEADFYECVSNDWHTGGGEHAYDTNLETDPRGNFTFFKTGDTHTPHGGCLMTVSKDGAKTEVFATGFRHPIGMGMSPTGILTGADQEGNWMPATRVDQYVKGGFYGDMRAAHRDPLPKTYDGPLCWIPREVDNSAGGQVWVPAVGGSVPAKDDPSPTPAKGWGPLAGLPLHLSYGRCKAFVLLRQELPDGRVQGGVSDLGLSFLSGVCRGRFSPVDGNLYVCGLNGWQTSAKADGCLQRVRYVGGGVNVPVKLAVTGDAVRLTFDRPLDAKAATDPKNWRAAAWNYRWSGEYGSKRWRVSNPAVEGQDDLPVRGVTLADGDRTAVVRFDLVPKAMQMQVAYNAGFADTAKLVGSVFFTVHGTNGK